MLDALRAVDWAPRSLRRLRRDVDSTIARLRSELGREPQESEIAEAMRLSPAELEKSLEQLSVMEVATLRPLDAPGPDGETLLDVAIDPGEGPAIQFERGELRRRLADAVAEARRAAGHRWRPSFAVEAKIGKRSIEAVEAHEPTVGVDVLERIGRALSHRGIVQDAAERGLRSVLVIEDETLFLDRTDAVLDGAAA